MGMNIVTEMVWSGSGNVQTKKLVVRRCRYDV